MKVGIDTIETERCSKFMADNNLLKKVFTSTEIAYFNKFSDKLSHISGNFCAKEAFVKALKTGFSNGISPLDIEILHEESGAPYINVNNEKLLKFINKDAKVELSISHSKTIATAICIIF